MVWEYQLTTIVMLTRSTEKGKVKSHSNITSVMLTNTSNLFSIQKNNITIVKLLCVQTG